MKITDFLNAEIMNVLLGVSAGLIMLWLVSDITLKTFMHENEVKGQTGDLQQGNSAPSLPQPH